jgi:hypothetical protein
MEAEIFDDTDLTKAYLSLLVYQRMTHISVSSSILWYSENIIRGRWPEAEKHLRSFSPFTQTYDALYRTKLCAYSPDIYFDPRERVFNSK